MTHRRYAALLLVFVFGCAGSPRAVPPRGDAPVEVDYTVRVQPGLRAAEVHVCFDSASVRSLVPMGRTVTTRLQGARFEGHPLVTWDEAIRLPEAKAPFCVDYTTRFEPTWLPTTSSSTVVSQADWLWRPEPFPEKLHASVRMVLPDGGRASLPWSRENGVYQPDRTAFFIESYVALGSFDSVSLSLSSGDVEVARLGGEPGDEAIRRWIDRAIRAASSLGRPPAKRLQFVVVPVDTPRDDVVFGMLRRGGGASILLVPSERATRGRLDDDWVAVHELSHLWLPRFVPQDRWLSEGFATYLQEVLRARCGLQTEARARRRLLDGFERGRRSGTGRPLAREAYEMDGTGAYHRVYWAGAAFAFEADLWLREQSDGRDTLLAALAREQPRWSQRLRPARREELLAALDPSGALERLGEKYAQRSEFPDTRFAVEPANQGAVSEILQRDDTACSFSAESYP